MFYSHEVLTSRRYGVATVWLVATLGASSALRKVNRKAILDVNVPKACETILAPEAPMALRLQSNLLYGVSRVYSQQCGYVLLDAQSAQNSIRALLKSARANELDPDAGKARPDQLILADDPAFFPDLGLPGLDLDFSISDLSSAGSHSSSLLSPHSAPSSRSSEPNVERSAIGLVIPTSDLGDVGDFAGLTIGSDGRVSARRDGRLGLEQAVRDEDEGFFPDVDFEFDADGNMREVRADDLPPRQRDLSSFVGPRTARPPSDSAASERVRREHEEGWRMSDLPPPTGEGLDVIMGEDYALPIAVEPLPPVVAAAASAGDALAPASSPPGHALPESTESSTTVEAPLRRIRVPKVIAMDTPTQLRNTELTSWNATYASNMVSAARAKQGRKLAGQARSNAAFWTFGVGLGNIGSHAGLGAGPHPLQMFSGAALMEALAMASASASPDPHGRKRGRDAEEELAEDSEGRRVRQRGEDEEQLDRGAGMMTDEEGMLPVLDDDGVEVGREAVPEMQDHHSSAMPWNISASLRGSHRGSSAVTRGRSALPMSGGFSGRASSQHSVNPALLPRRASRLLSSSPLVGRGRASPADLERLSSLELNFPGLSGEDETMLLGARDPEQGQEAAAPHTTTVPSLTPAAARKAGVAIASLDRESANFLAFLQADIQQQQRLHGVEPGERGSVFFATLLPPPRTGRAVAAQAFAHTLLLATKALVEVEPTVGEAWGDVCITPVVGA
ncbi:MAG: hypothetical protein M1832_002491 [Thelocarpon impressellum]|nr:MAG: hypothetical protein M1832_002491 [Thelocarpon impressellum]